MQAQLTMLLHTLLFEQTHATTLVSILINTYFSGLSSILVVYNSKETSDLNFEYQQAVQQTLQNHSQHGSSIGLQWLNVATFNEFELEAHLLLAVDIVTEGFITILSNTSNFLHARYYATRNAELRLKDKFYLFLCEDENPKDFLQLEILQFYPHHLMVTTSAQTPMQGPAMQTSMNAEAEMAKNLRTTTRTSAAIGSKSKFASFTTTPNATKVSTIQHQNINFELWTQKFVGVAGNLDAVHLDSFEPSKTFTKNVELYPNKLLNLKGRALRVGSITYIPYVVSNYVAAGTGNVDPINANEPNRSVFYAGSEANLIMTFCEVYNCHLRLEAYGVDNWGMIYENETSTGMLGDIYTQYVELAIGCIYNWYNNITETSKIISRSAVTIMGPAPARFPAWRTNIMPFTQQLWNLLFATMLMCVFILHVIKFSFFKMRNLRKRQFHHYNTCEQALLNIFAIFIQQPTAEKSISSFPARFFLTTLFMAAITLENTYSGQLKSILTIPFYTEPVDTMDKLSKTEWKWGAPSVVWVQTVENSDLLMEQILTKKFEIRDYDFLYNASFRADYGLAIERLLSGAFSFGDFITAAALETKIIPKDDLYFDWTRAVSIRGWPLMPLFDRHVQACMETGLFVHWERQMVWRYLDRQAQQIMLALASGYVAKAPPQKLTLENVSGAMFALLFGYVFAFIALLMELFGNVVVRGVMHLKQNMISHIHFK